MGTWTDRAAELRMVEGTQRASSFWYRSPEGRVKTSDIFEGLLFASILVCLSCYNRIPQTGCPTNNGNLFLTGLETGSPRSGRWQIWCLMRVSWFVDGCLLTQFSHDGRAEGALWGLFYKDTNPIHEGGALMTQSPPKCPISECCHTGR